MIMLLSSGIPRTSLTFDSTGGRDFAETHLGWCKAGGSKKRLLVGRGQ